MSVKPTCHGCQRNFGERKSLLRHQRETSCLNNNVVVNIHPCELCDKTFPRAYGLQRHRKETHFGIKRNRNGPQQQILKRGPDQMDSDMSVAYGRKRTATEVENDTLKGIGTQFQSVIDLTMPLGLPPGNEAPLKRTDVANLACAIPCGICGLHVSTQHPGKLRKHLNSHFKALQESHSCNICQIGFKHKSDLEAHLRSAGNGDCGFMFVHKSKCTGHHPPCESRPANSRWKVGNQIISTDNDRFDFCFRLRQWETFQLASYRSSIDAVMATAGAGRNAITEICPSSTCGSRRGCRSYDPSASRSYRHLPSIDPQGIDTQLAKALLKEDDGKAAKESNDALIRAVCTGNLELVSSHIAAGADVHAVDDLGFSCINWALKCSWPDIVDLLVSKGAVASSSDLCYAIEHGLNIHVIARLITDRVTVNCPGSYMPVCWAALHAAVKTRRTVVAALLLQSGADVHHRHTHPHDVDESSNMLMLKSHERIVESLIDASRMVRPILRDDEAQDPCLHLAVAMGDFAMVKLLLDHGAYVDEGDSGGVLLFLAAWRKDRDIERELRVRGASAQCCLCGCNTPIVLAAEVAEALCSARDSGNDFSIRATLGTPSLTQMLANGCKLVERIMSSSGDLLAAFRSSHPGYDSDAVRP